jgi:hypothetical protein
VSGSRRPTREELAARRRALRETLDRKRSALKRPERRRPWRRWVLLALLLLLLMFLLRDCRCNEPPVEEPVAEGVAGEAGLPSEPPPPPPAPLTGRVDRVDRPEFGTAAPAAIPWLDAFRLQVAARSPRLAECFVGAERPGTLKWSALVEPASGKVSDQTLEPTLLSDALTVEQRDCALAVLSTPAYRLQGNDERSTPSRISMAIEF